MLSREKGEIGRRARKTLKKRKDLKKKRYTTRKDTLKNLITGIGGMGLAVPIFMVSPKVGYTLMSKSIKKYRKLTKPKWEGQGYRKKYHGKEKAAQFLTFGLYGATKNYNEAKEKQKKKEGEVSKTLEYIKNIDGYNYQAMNKWRDITNDINSHTQRQENSGLTEEQARQVRKNSIMDDVKFAVLDTSNNMIKENIYNFGNVNGSNSINRENIDEVIDNALAELGVVDRFTEEQIQSIKDATRQSFDYSTARYTDQVAKLASDLHESIINIGIEDTNIKELAMHFDKIEKTNETAQKTVKSRVVDTERLIDNMKFE